MSTMQNFKCPRCGGALEFNSTVQSLSCPYCGTQFETSALNELDEVISETVDNEPNWQPTSVNEWLAGEEEGLNEYICNSCGGSIVTDATTGATKCPYCDNPVVLVHQFQGSLKPDYVIPFKLDKQAAKEQFKAHLSDKPLLPKVFTSNNHIDEIKAVYVPFWLYDATVDAKVRFTGSKTRTWSDYNYQYEETSYYSIYRAGTLDFEDVPSNGSTKVNREMMESIEPFDMSKAVDFKTAYLAGYLADKYDIDYIEGAKVANERIRNTARGSFYNTVSGYDMVNVESSHLQLQNEKVKYCLLPVWLLSTRFNGETYLFAMNGQTGKFVGDLPTDNGLYWSKFATIMAAVSAATALVTFLLKVF